MKNRVLKYFLLAAVLAGATLQSAAQTKVGNAEFDALTHDFGDILLGSGAVSWTFSVKNVGSAPLAIYSVTTTCGCTAVEWTKEPLKSGAVGKISVSYSNDEGPYPFDKPLSVYLSGSSKPVTLRIRGVCRQKELSLEESHPLRMGVLGVKSADVNGGETEQGRPQSGVISVANLSSSTVELSVANVSEGLSVKGACKMKKRSSANLEWTVTPDRRHWGRNSYGFDLLANGKKAGRINVSVSTKENFSSLSKEERARGPRPMFTASSYTFKRVKAGTPIKAVFNMKNGGKEVLRIYKVDSDSPKLSCPSIPELAPGAGQSIEMNLDTSGMPSGEVLIIVSLTTNSPLRPVVNLFVTGWIE